MNSCSAPSGRAAHRAGAALLLLTSLTVCDGKNGGNGPGVEIDTIDTQELVMGEDFLLIVNITNCPNNPSAVVRTGDTELASYGSLPVITLMPFEEVRNIVQVPVSAANLPVSTYGLPAQVDVTVEIECDTGRSVSEPVTIAHLPTANSFVPTFNPRRFWPSDVEGEYIVCDGTDLIHVALDGTETDLNLGFSCSLGELRGVLGFRRYMISEDTGIAAIDPSPASDNLPIVAWSRTLFVRGSVTTFGYDPVVIERISGLRQMYILDQDDGQTLAGPITLDRIPLGDGVRAPNDDIVLLESERDGTNSLTYYLKRFDSLGNDLGSTELALYPFDASAFIARFDPLGEHIYVTAAPVSEDEMWLEKREINTCTTTCPLVWSTQGAGPWFVPLGEQNGRVLAATPDELQWLDPATGATIGQPFATETGAAFLRGGVEDDGSIVVIGEQTAGNSVAQALYIFRPDGTMQFRFGSPEVLFRWLVPAWNGAILVSYMDGIHQLLPRQIYDDLANPP